MRTRLRPAHSPEDLARIYATPHDHRLYGRGHAERVRSMIRLGTTLVAAEPVRSLADLSCGNGAVASAIPAAVRYLGDFAPGYAFRGPIEETVQQVPRVDLFVMGETLEHLDDPGLVLREVADRARWLLLSTPVDNWEDTNAEHYWAWDRRGVEDLMSEAGFDVEAFDVVDSRPWGEPYCYGIWLARRAD